MRHISRRMLPALLAVLALSAAAATAAQAADAPHYTVEPKTGEAKRLGAGETRNIFAKNFSANIEINDATFKLEIVCKASVKTGAGIFGSAIGEPGGGEQELELTSCKGTEDGKACASVENFISLPLKLELVKAVSNKNLEVTLKPVKGSTLGTINFGAPCIQNMKLTGELIEEVRYDTGGTLGGHVEVGAATPTAKSWALQFMDPQPAAVITYKAGVETHTNAPELEGGGTPLGGLSGSLEVSLANSKGELTSEPWSP